MPKALIAGVGMTRFGRHPDKTIEQLACEAIEEALGESQMDFREVQSAVCGAVLAPVSTGARVMAAMGRTGITCPDIQGACSAGANALRMASIAVESGQCDVALVLGVDKAKKGFMPATPLYEDWQCQLGLSQNPMFWALCAKRHMHDYGTTEMHFAKVAAKAKRNGAMNPKALFQEAMSIEQILASKLVVDPMRLYMLCSPSDGAAAILVVSDRVAHQYTRQPIEISACETTIAPFPLMNAPAYCATPTRNPSVYAHAAARAYEKAGLGPSDIDVAEVQDGDAFSEIEAIEELGFCARGEGGRLVDEGATDLQGRIPVNTGGGLLARGEPPGASHLGQIYELVKQLRGQAGPRQVKKARTALAQVYGGWGHCGITILKAAV
jgi:acetyl-CoA acetyltransferase